MLQVTQVASARPGWVERVLELDPIAGPQGVHRRPNLPPLFPSREVLRAQVEQGAKSHHDAVLSWQPTKVGYGNLFDLFLSSVVPAYGYKKGTPVVLECLINGTPETTTLLFPITSQEVASWVRSRKVTARDVLAIVIANVGDELTLDVELDSSEEALLCSVVLTRIVLPVIAPFITKTHENSNMNGNGELAATALSDDTNRFVGALALAAPLPVEY